MAKLMIESIHTRSIISDNRVICISICVCCISGIILVSLSVLTSLAIAVVITYWN